MTLPLPNLLREFSYSRCGATWRSGYATVCKTVYPGSIPGVASTQTRARDEFVPCAAVQGAGKAQCAPACCGIGGKAGLTCVPRIKSSARLSTLSSFGLGGM
jgi:hypothetical protein